MKKITTLLKQFANYYVGRKQQFASAFRCMLGIAILLAIALYGFIRLLFQDFDISLIEDVMNMIRATGLATLFICILFLPCVLLELLVHLSRIETNGATASSEAKTDMNVQPTL